MCLGLNYEHHYLQATLRKASIWDDTSDEVVHQVEEKDHLALSSNHGKQQMQHQKIRRNP